MAKRIAIFVGLVVLAPWLAISSFVVPLDTKPTPTPIPAGLTVKDLPPPVADAGWDIITYVGIPTHFQDRMEPGHGRIIKQEWDFDGDGTYDWSGSPDILAFHTYTSIGQYQAKFKVTDEYGLWHTDRLNVIVKPGKGRQTLVKQEKPRPNLFGRAKKSKDGTVNRYAILINGGNNEDYWNDIDTFYIALNEYLGIDSSHIYVLNEGGTSEWDSTRNYIIDYPATLACLDTVFSRLETEDSIDADDHLYIVVSDHGGYDYDVSVEDDDEKDTPESVYKPSCKELEGWNAIWGNSCSNDLPLHYRLKYVSHFDNTYFQDSDTSIADDDIWLEEFTDYLAGDSAVTDGYIDPTLGELFDFDDDGNPPYNPETGLFDEDDWGDINMLSGEYGHSPSTFVPGHFCCLFDSSLDNTTEIDVDCDSEPVAPAIDGTDTDNDGYFNGVDVNSDGDMDDTLSRDEYACLYGGQRFPDDYLAEHLDSLGEVTVITMMRCCYSGGFVWDLSGTKRVTMTSTREGEFSYGTAFVKSMAEAIIDPTVADSIDVDGCASMTEVFNYACIKLTTGVEQYDDNGDSESHAYPMPDSGDGALGRILFFDDDCSTQGYLLYYSHSCSDSVHDDNGYMNPEDTIHMSVTIEHTGLTSATAQSVVCTLRTDFSHITMLDSTASFGDIESCDTATSNDVFSFVISTSAPDSSQVDFELYAYTGDTLAGTRAFSQMIYKPGFTIACEPGTLITYFTPLGKQWSGKGGTSGIDVILTPYEGFSSTVTLSCSGVCSGIIASIIPNQVTPPDTSTLSFGRSLFCQPQICSTIVVKATGGGVTNYRAVTHVLRNNPENDSVFYVSPSGHDLWDGKEDYPLKTIQKGVEWADGGDTVLVAQGTYEEQVTIYKDSIVVTSYHARDEQESYIESTVIDGGGSGPVVRIDTCLEVTLRGFTIKNGGSTDPGHGIYCDNSTADILYNRITDSYCGIRSYKGDLLYLFRNLVYSNSLLGIQLEDGSGSNVINNSIAENGYGGLEYSGGTSVCKNNIISHNVTFGIQFLSGALVSVNYNDVWGNPVNYCGSGIYDSTGNISQNPRYGYLDGGNLHLSFNSPCIDSGDTSDTPPEGGGDCIDMGAIEYIPLADTGCGDVNADGFLDWGDHIYLLAYLFTSGPAPARVCLGDVNCSGDVTVGDVTYLQYYLNGTGDPPCDTCCQEE